MNRESLIAWRDSLLTFKENLRDKKQPYEIYVKYGYHKEKEFSDLIKNLNAILNEEDTEV